MVQTETIKITVDDSTVERAAKRVLKLSDTLKIVQGSTVEVNSKFIKLNDGLTKSQSGMLAMLKQAGASVKQMKEFSSILDRINKFSSVNPFDATTNPLGFVKKQREELEKSIKLSEKYNDLTKEQVALISRGSEFARQKAKMEGLSFGQREAYVKKYVADMVEEMRSQNSITESIKQKNAAHAQTVREQENLRKAEADRIAQQKELNALHEKNLAGNTARLEKSVRQEVKAWQKAQDEIDQQTRKKAEADQKLVITALRKDWAQTVDANAKMKHPLHDYFKQMEIDSKKAAAEVEANLLEARKAAEKNAKFVSDARTKNWASSVGTKSPELSAMSDFYKKQEAEARVHQQNMAEIERQGNLIIVNEQQALIGEMDKRKKMWKDLYGADHAKAVREEIKNNKELKSSEEARNKILSDVGPNMSAYNKALDDRAKATSHVTTADEKLNFQIEKMKEGLTSANANQLFKYRESLINAGVATDDITKRIDKFQQKLVQKQKASPFEQMRKDLHSTSREMDRLARGLSVQMGDVAVSLASGMNPLMVMIQQGDQIRGLITQSGIEGKELSKSMSLAAGQIATSFKGTAAAIGGFFTGAIVSAGKAVTDLAMKLPFLQKATDALGVSLAVRADAGDVFAARLLSFSKAIPAVIGSLMALAAVISGVVLVALYQVSKQEDELAKQLALTGGSLGMNQAAALNYAKSLNDVGISTSKAIDVITAMAKEGGFAANEIEMIAIAASSMSKYLDVSIEDTVKAFSKLKEEPTKALAEIAKATGMVTQETLKTVQELERQGKESDAAALAMKAYADVQVQQVQRVKEEYSNFTMFFIELGSQISSFWDKVVKGALNKATPSEMLSQDLYKVTKKLENVWISDGRRKELETERDAIAEQVRLLAKSGSMISQQQVEQSKAASDILETEKLRVKTLSDVQTKQEEIDKLTAEISKNSSRWGKESEHILVRQARIKQLNKEIADIQSKKKPKTDAEKYYDKIQERVADIYNKTVLQADEVGIITDAYKAQLDVLDDPLWKELSSKRKQHVLDELMILDIKQQQMQLDAEYRDKVRKAWEVSLDAQKKEDDFYTQRFDSLVEQGEQIEKQSKDLELQFKILGKNEEEVKAITGEYEVQRKLTEINNALAKEKIEINNNIQKSDQDRLDLITKAEKNAEVARGNVYRETALKAAQDFQKAFEGIQSTLTDIIATALFEGGKAGQKKLKDVLKNAFRNFVIDVFINPITKDITSAFMSGGSAGGSGGGSTMNFISGAKTAWDMFANGGLSSSIAKGFSTFANSSMGQSLGLSTTSTGWYDAGTTTMTPMGSSIGAGAQYAGNAAMGYAAYKGISGGYSTGLPKGLTNTAAIVGSAINPIVGAVMGGINRAFGRKLTGQGIQGTFGGTSGFEGSAYTFQKGGLFRSDKETTSALSEGQRSGFATAFNVIKQSTKAMATALGLGAESIDSFTKEVKINLLGLSEEDAAKKIQETFTGISEDMAKLALGTTEYSRHGETAVETLTRLSSSLSYINSIASKLDWTLEDVGLAGANSASTLIELAGGIDKFQSKVSYYYENFFSEEERLVDSQQDLVKEFTKLNKQVPKTKEEFRAMLTAAQNSGMDDLVNSLLDLAPAINNVVTAAQALAQAHLEKNVDSLTNSFESIADIEQQISEARNETIRKQLELDKEGYENQLENAKKLNEAAKSLRAYVKDLLLGTESYLSPQQRLSQLKSTYASQLTAARAGDSAAFGDLQGTTSAYLELFKSQARSSTDYAREMVLMTTELESLGKTTETSTDTLIRVTEQKLTLVQTKLDALSITSSKSLTELQSMLTTAKAQYQQDLKTAAAQAIADDNIADVLSALPTDIAAELSSALKATLIPTFDALIAKITAGNVGNLNTSSLSTAVAGKVSTGGTSIAGASTSVIKDIIKQASTSGLNLTQSAQLYENIRDAGYSTSQLDTLIKEVIPTGSQADLDTLRTAANVQDFYNTVLGRQADNAGIEYWTNLVTNGTLNSSTIVDAMKAAAIANVENINQSALTSYVPKFAKGGYYQGGMALVGEQGPELINFSQPGQVYNNRQTQGILSDSGDDSELIQELQALRQEVVMLRAEVRADVAHNAKTAKLLDRVIPDGQSIQVVTAV